MIYSKYRRRGMSESIKALICVACIAFMWAWVSEMDYREQTQTVCYQEAA